MGIYNDDVKWEDFEKVVLPTIVNSVDCVYAIALNKNEASVITAKMDKITMIRYFENEDSLVEIDINGKYEFNTTKECLDYLRLIREDHANNYDYKMLVKKLISQLYLNNVISVGDIIS